MNGSASTVVERDARLDALAAELTSAAYPIALRHDSGESWVDLELALWKAVSETIRRWDRGLPPHPDGPEIVPGPPCWSGTP
jgi:hypothetical protein